jgi:hypothetical protein
MELRQNCVEVSKLRLKSTSRGESFLVGGGWAVLAIADAKPGEATHVLYAIERTRKNVRAAECGE